MCGTDNKTYFNKCIFESEKCFGGDDDLEIAHSGICADDPFNQWQNELAAPTPVESTPAPVVARKENAKLSKLDIQKQRLQKRKQFREQRRKKQQKEMAEKDEIMIEGSALI